MDRTTTDHRQRMLHALAGDRGAATLQNTIIAPVLAIAGLSLVVCGDMRPFPCLRQLLKLV